MAFKDLIQSKSNTTSKEIIVEGFAINEKPGNMNLQLCRSSCSWSTGILNVEHSIYNAYLELISNAEEFIYIENQFFMSHEN
jgi:phosphatidylserine/phosphatidylglycerophosphate/cardiolipin synthase-like enzyme